MWPFIGPWELRSKMMVIVTEDYELITRDERATDPVPGKNCPTTDF
jgi:hypothetical protein